jgi:ankyrin repeat protein
MLKINDAHGGKGSQEQVGEGAFIALVEFQAYFNLLTKNQKKLIPSPVMQAIEKLLDVSSNMRGSSMVGNIETCAGSRREQIEQAMLGQTQQLMQITLNDDTKQGALLEEQKKLDYLKQQLKSNLELKKYTGADTLGFNPSLLQKIALSYSVKTIDDLNELKKLSTKDLHEVLKGNPQLNQQILAIIKTIDDLVIFSSGVTPENLQLLLSFFGPEFKKIIVDPLVFFELVLHHQDLKKLFLLSWYFDVGGKILNTGNPLVSKLIGDLRKIKKIYSSEITDNPENLAIIFAALTGDEEKIRLALEKDLSLLCLTWLVAKNNQYQKIANQLYEEILKRPNGVNKALQMAMVEGDEDAVEKLLLDERIGVWQHNSNGQTPLHLAALNGFKLTHKLWERMKIDVHAQDVFGNTALMYAIKKKNIEMAHLILQTNLNVNLKNQAQFSALSLAAQSGQEELVIELLKHPNIIDSQEIALELAVIHGHAAIVRRLLNRFSTKTKTLNLDSFCQKAIQNDHIHVFSELIKHMEPAQQKQQIKKNIELAMSKKFYGYVVILLDMSSVVRIQMGQDILHEAVRLNEPELVKALLKRDIPATELALTEAIQNDNTDIICLLLENLAIEADHPLLDTLYQKYQFKALEILLQAGRQDLMEKFLQKDTIDLHQIDEKGETVLFQLAKNKDASFRKIFKRLCETNKVDVNVFNRMFKDLMERRDFKAIKFLLTIKKDERYLIQINDEVVKFLSDNDMQKSALMFAANIGRVDLFQKILANNTTLTAEEISDIAKLTEEDVFSVMLEHIDVNATMLPGLYPGNLLHALIRLAYIKAKSQDIYLAKAYEIILKTNIDLNVRNGFGQTAFDLIPEGQKSIFFDNLFKQMIASSKHKKLLEALLPGWDQLAWKSSNQEIIELYLKLAQIPQLIDNKQDVTEAQVAQQISDYLKNTITGFLIMSMFWNAAEFLGLIDKTDKPLVYQMLDTLEEKQAEKPSPR